MTSLTVSVDSSETKLFTDASLIFRMINSQQDADYLQKDLTALEKWEREWQMSFRPEKCTVVRIHATKNSVINTTYTMYNQVLQTTASSKNLGVTLSDDLTWQKHVDITTSKVKKAKIRNQYNQALHLTQDTNWTSQTRAKGSAIFQQVTTGHQ